MKFDSLAAALADLQANLPTIAKGQTAKVETTKGSYTYQYADLADISPELLPLLSARGLAFTCAPKFRESRFVLVAKLIHVSGESDEAEYPLPTSGTPQGLGSAITYGRRHCLCAMTGLALDKDDDDAAAAQAEAGKRGTAQRAARPAATGSTAQRKASTTAPPLPTDGQITREQQANLRDAFSDAGYTDKAEMLAYARKVAGRELESAAHLTQAEADRVIAKLTAPPDDTVPPTGGAA